MAEESEVIESEGKGEGEGGAAAGAGSEVTADDIHITGIQHNDNPSVDNGSENSYVYTYYIGEDETTYKAYVYGSGVTEDICKQIAAAYFNRKTVVDSSLTDAEKSSVDHEYNEGYDKNLCWAYSASDSLWDTAWIKLANAGIFNIDGSAASYFGSVDDLASYAAYCLFDKGGDEKNFWKWIFNGSSLSADALRYGVDEDDALLYEYYDSSKILYYDLDAGATLAESLDAVWTSDYDCSSTLGLYQPSGHAVSLTGFILDSDSVPIAVVIADPDNGVEDETQSDVPSEKDNSYNVLPIRYDSLKGKWIFTDGYTDAYIGDISVLKDVNDAEKLNDSIIPTAVRAIADTFDSTAEYFFSSNYSIGLPFNFDFLSFYDINKINYRLLDSDGEVLVENSLTNAKSVWKALFDEGETDITLSFVETLSNLVDGSYKLQVEIDKDCFYGNYGWFAQRFGSDGYFDRLVDVWVKLYRSSGGDSQDESSSQDDWSNPEDASASADVEEMSYNAEDDEEIAFIIDTIIEELINQLNIDYSKLAPVNNDNMDFVVETVDGEPNVNIMSTTTQQIEACVKLILNDILKAAASDQKVIDSFKMAGIDVTQMNVKNLNVLMSSSVSVKKAGTVKLSGSKKYTSNDKVYAMIRQLDGTVRYVKASVAQDGSIVLALPSNVGSITVFAL